MKLMTKEKSTMPEEIKILWEPEWGDKTKSHAYLDDETQGDYRALCGCQFLETSDGSEPPEERKCKHCLRILARVGRVR